MIHLNDTLKITLLVVVCVSYFIYLQKPSIMFKKDGSFKTFGLRSGETILPFHIGIILVGFFTYYVLILYGGKYI